MERTTSQEVVLFLWLKFGVKSGNMLIDKIIQEA